MHGPIALRVFLLVGVALASSALGALTEGARFPVFDGTDVAGVGHSTAEYRGRRTMVVVISDRGATDDMRAWWNTADRRLPEDVQRKSIVSIGVPFFIGADYARSKARDDIPRQYWDDTLLDIHRTMAKRLGLGKSGSPWVFVLDADMGVVAIVHAKAASPEAERIWRALGRP